MEVTFTNPFPPTLDGAASAMPKGWDWGRDMFSWVADKGTLGVSCRRTGDETRDRYLLAAEAVMKEAGE